MTSQMGIHAVLPTQDLGGADTRLAEPHKRLMVAVLQAVVDDCRGGTLYRRAAGPRRTAPPQGIRQAIAYVASTDRDWAFSFENICDALGIDADAIRQKLRRERGALRGDEDRAGVRSIEPSH